MPENLKGKRILLTGATRGIGLGAARHLLKLGASVMGTGKDGDRLESAAAELSTLGEFTPLQLDLSRPDSAAKLAAAAVASKWGVLDALVNNAAIGGTWQSLPEAPARELEDVFTVNVFGCHAMIRETLPLLLKGVEPTVINVSSEAGQTSNLFKDRGGEVYIFSKYALNALTLLWARDLRGKVAVNSMHPGWISTDMGGKEAPEDLMVGGFRVLQSLQKPFSETGKFYFGAEEMPW